MATLSTSYVVDGAAYVKLEDAEFEQKRVCLAHKLKQDSSDSYFHMNPRAIAYDLLQYVEYTPSEDLRNNYPVVKQEEWKTYDGYAFGAKEAAETHEQDQVTEVLKQIYNERQLSSMHNLIRTNERTIKFILEGDCNGPR